MKKENDEIKELLGKRLADAGESDREGFWDEDCREVLEAGTNTHR